MSGGGAKTTSSSSTSPYPQAKGLLDSGLNGAQNLYNTQQLNPYTPMSNFTHQGLSGQISSAQANAPAAQQALDTTRSFTWGAGDVGSGMQTDIANRALGPSMSEQNLSGIAKGNLINQGDPNYDRLRQRAMEDASTEAGMAASGLGRTGSDYHQAAVGSRVADTVGNMDYQRLQNERANQVQANTLIDQMRQSGYGIGLNAANSATATQTGNQDRRFNAAGAVPGMIASAGMPYQQILDAGRAYDVDAAARAGAPGANLSSLMQILGIAQPFSTTNGTQTEPSNKAGQIAGGGLGLASLLFG